MRIPVFFQFFVCLFGLILFICHYIFLMTYVSDDVFCDRVWISENGASISFWIPPHVDCSWYYLIYEYITICKYDVQVSFMRKSYVSWKWPLFRDFQNKTWECFLVIMLYTTGGHWWCQSWFSKIHTNSIKKDSRPKVNVDRCSLNMNFKFWYWLLVFKLCLRLREWSDKQIYNLLFTDIFFHVDVSLWSGNISGWV